MEMTSATSASQLADALAQSQPSAAFIKHSVALATARSATLAITHDPSTSHQTPRFLQPEPLPEEFVPGTRRSGDHALSQRPHLNLAPTVTALHLLDNLLSSSTRIPVFVSHTRASCTRLPPQPCHRCSRTHAEVLEHNLLLGQLFRAANHRSAASPSRHKQL